MNLNYKSKNNNYTLHLHNLDICEQNHDELDFECLGKNRGKEWDVKNMCITMKTLSLGRRRDMIFGSTSQKDFTHKPSFRETHLLCMYSYMYSYICPYLGPRLEALFVGIFILKIGLCICVQILHRRDVDKEGGVIKRNGGKYLLKLKYVYTTIWDGSEWATISGS